MMKKTSRRLWVTPLLVLWFILAAGYVFLSCSPAPEKPAAPAVKEVKRDLAFAQYPAETSTFTASLPEYSLTPEELVNLKDFKEAGQAFTPAQIKVLAERHFFIAPNLDKFYQDDPQALTDRYDDWTQLYGEMGGPEPPAQRRPHHAVFVTSDYLLHVYHRLLERHFEYLEQKKFYPVLRRLSHALLDAAVQEYARAAAPAQKESWQRLIAYFAVPAAILDAAGDYSARELIEDSQADSPAAILAALEKLQARMPAESYAAARRELELIIAADQAASSPLLGKYQGETGLSLPEDYTQYRPRSHYAKNPVLRCYFRAMMWYGRMNFLTRSPQLTRDAAHIAWLVDQTGRFQDWENIYLPTVFFVGESDDLGLYEYRQALKDLGLGGGTAPALDDQTLAKFQQEVKSYRKPQLFAGIMVGEAVPVQTKEELQAQTQGFRFMGQRFTPDALIFSRLTQGEEKPDPRTGERLPTQPTALMLMEILGSPAAALPLGQWLDVNAPDSKKVLATRLEELTRQFNALTVAQWTQNLYFSWLYTLRAVLTEPRDWKGFPMFMKSPAWGLKNLVCSLGSWTELKHDTLLYAKQVYAEMGNGEEEEKPPPVPRGYVEPNIAFWDRLISLIEMTREGFQARELLDQEFVHRYERLQEDAVFFRRLALVQLRNETIPDEDFEKLRLTPGNLNWVVGPLPNEVATEAQARAALIADVFTDAVKGQVLYEATGIPNYIYVAVKDANGARLTKGLVFTHHEFSEPLGKRYTDDDWQRKVYSPDWIRLENNYD